MPLNLSNRDQNSGHLFYNRRLRAAITRFSVRMKHDDRKQQAALALAAVFVVLGCGWMALLNVVKPAGIVGQAEIVGNRDTGAVYAVGQAASGVESDVGAAGDGKCDDAHLGQAGRDRQTSDRAHGGNPRDTG